jgi:hypothetical protein
MPMFAPYSVMTRARLIRMLLVSSALILTMGLNFISLWFLIISVPCSILGGIFLLFTYDEWAGPSEREWWRASKWN